MKYMHRVLIGDRATYLVEANDSAKAVRRAQRMYEAQFGSFPSKQDPIMVRSLTPKQVGDEFFPRVGGQTIGSAHPTAEQALQYSIDHSLEIMRKRKR